MEKIALLVTIAEPGRSSELIEYYKAHELPMPLLTKGHGTAGKDILDFLGLGEPKRDLIFSIMTLPRAKKMIYWLKAKMLFDIPGNGIAFIILLDSVAGGKTLNYFSSGAEVLPESSEEDIKRMSEYKHELIMAIINRGHADEVMAAAREAQAGGGTVVHARGTGAKLAEKFFGVTLSDEKEIVFIVADTENRNAIMKNIVNQAGIKSAAQSIVFSVPVSEVLGIRERLQNEE